MKKLEEIGEISIYLLFSLLMKLKDFIIENPERKITLIGSFKIGI